MWRAWLTLIIGLNTAAGCKYVEEKLAHKDAGPASAPQDAPTVPGTGLEAGKTYRVASLRLEFEHKRWDSGSPPDPKATITANGKRIGTCSAQDTYILQCRPKAHFELRADTEVEIDIVDRDVLTDDPMGSARIAGLIRAGASASTCRCGHRAACGQPACA